MPSYWLSAVHVTSESEDFETMLKDVTDGRYTLVYSSPEFLVGNTKMKSIYKGKELIRAKASVTP